MQGLVHNFISSCILWKWKCLHIFVYFLFSLFLLSFCVIFLNSLIYLTMLGLSLGIFSCGMHSFSCDMRDLVPWPGIKPGRDALEAQSSSHCSVQLLSRVWLFATPWTAARQASLSITSSQSLPKLMSIESVMLPNHLILCHPLLLLLSVFPSIRVF